MEMIFSKSPLQLSSGRENTFRIKIFYCQSTGEGGRGGGEFNVSQDEKFSEINPYFFPLSTRNGKP